MRTKKQLKTEHKHCIREYYATLTATWRWQTQLVGLNRIRLFTSNIVGGGRSRWTALADNLSDSTESVDLSVALYMGTFIVVCNEYVKLCYVMLCYFFLLGWRSILAP